MPLIPAGVSPSLSIKDETSYVQYRRSHPWMLYTTMSATRIARECGCVVPRNINAYVDDTFCTILNPPPRTGLRSGNNETRDTMADFQECLNAVHDRVKFTMEKEENGTIAFLDVLISRENDGQLSTKVYRKASNTNIMIKPQSCQDPLTADATFKGELCRAHRLCSSPSQVKKEVDFLLDLFEDNGHCRSRFEKISNTYAPPSHTQKQTTKEKKKQTKTNIEKEIRSLFQVLPFREDNEEDEEEERKSYACITYIPEIAHQLKRAYKKAGINTVFKSAPKLKDLLCSKNKTKPDPEKKKGVYRYSCPCSSDAIYIGQTARSFELRWEEHKRAIDNQNWHHSGITQHYENCASTFSKDNFDIVSNAQGKSKKKLAYDIKIRESLEIRRHGSGPGKGLNEDNGSYIRTDIWDPVLNTIGT